MEKLKASSPDVRVLGQSVVAFIECTNREDIWQILEQHGIREVDSETWYPQQMWLDVLRDITQHHNSMFNLVSVGMALAESAPVPPHVDSIEGIMQAMDDHYLLSHQNEHPGKMKTTLVGPGHIVVTSSTPYPDDFEYGVLYGLARKFAPNRNNLIVQHDHTQSCRKDGGKSCTYHITW